MGAAANIVVAVVGVDALEDEAAVKLVDAPATVAVDELVDAHVVVAVDELRDAEGGAGRETGPGTEKVSGVEWTAAAANAAGSLSSSSSKKRRVGFLGPTHVAIGQLS